MWRDRGINRVELFVCITFYITIRCKGVSTWANRATNRTTKRMFTSILLFVHITNIRTNLINVYSHGPHAVANSFVFSGKHDKIWITPNGSPIGSVCARQTSFHWPHIRICARYRLSNMFCGTAANMIFIRLGEKCLAQTAAVAGPNQYLNATV